jgi:hypothetical protein
MSARERRPKRPIPLQPEHGLRIIPVKPNGEGISGCRPRSSPTLGVRVCHLATRPPLSPTPTAVTLHRTLGEPESDDTRRKDLAVVGQYFQWAGSSGPPEGVAGPRRRHVTSDQVGHPPMLRLPPQIARVSAPKPRFGVSSRKRWKWYFPATHHIGLGRWRLFGVISTSCVLRVALILRRPGNQGPVP